MEKKEPDHRVQEEVGDLLHTAISLCLFAGFDVEETTAAVVKKFGRRIHSLKEIARAQGYTTLEGQPAEALLDLWRQAKKICFSSQVLNSFQDVRGAENSERHELRRSKKVRNDRGGSHEVSARCSISTPCP